MDDYIYVELDDILQNDEENEQENACFEYVQRFKNADGYSIPYFDETIDIRITDEKIKKYIKEAVNLLDKVQRLSEQNELTRELIEHRHEIFGGVSHDEDTMFRNIQTGFRLGGFYDYPEIHMIVKNVANLLRNNAERTRGLIPIEIKICSAVVLAVETYFGYSKYDEMYETCVWLFVRHCLYLEAV